MKALLSRGSPSKLSDETSHATSQLETVGEEY